MFRSLFLLIVAVLFSSSPTVAFAPATRPTSTPTTTLSMSDMRANDNDEGIAMMLPLAFKLAGVMTIKTAKDVVNYPPKMMEKVFNQKNNSKNELEEMSPFVMLFKLLGVLVFKTGHDLVYFPTLWAKRLVECQSLDECDVSDL
jgi:hypothetical protein